jgi:hypothetical protein
MQRAEQRFAFRPGDDAAFAFDDVDGSADEGLEFERHGGLLSAIEK